MRGCLRNPALARDVCLVYPVPYAGQPLVTTFLSIPVGGEGYLFDEGKGSASWTYTSPAAPGPPPMKWMAAAGVTVPANSWYPGGGHPTLNYLRTGINLDDDQTAYQGRVRFGLLLNNEAGINTADEAVGFGVSGQCASCGGTGPSCEATCVSAGSATGCGYVTADARVFQRGGGLWVR
jgi:hypothetical protein